MSALLLTASVRCCQCSCWRNENGYHLTGVNPGRDFEAEYVDIREAKEGESHQTVKVLLNLLVVSKLDTSSNSVLAIQKAWEQQSFNL